MRFKKGDFVELIYVGNWATCNRKSPLGSIHQILEASEEYNVLTSSTFDGLILEHRFKKVEVLIEDEY